MIEFIVPGDPVPQPRPRVSMRGGFARAYVPADHPVHCYRARIHEAALAAGLTARDEPFAVSIDAMFVRPKSHLLKCGALKSAAPLLPRPDVDNIAKAVLDALGELFDDTLVYRLCIGKGYGERAYTHVTIE